MEKWQIEFISEVVKDMHELKKDARNSIINDGFQLLLAQIDLMKTLASLVIGFSAIWYIYEQASGLDNWWLLWAFIFWLLTLIFSVSWSREIIDFHDKQNGEILEELSSKVHNIEQTALQARKDDDFNMFYTFSQKEANKPKPPTPIPSYIWEIVVFLFYAALGFLIVSFYPFLFPDACPYLRIFFYVMVPFMAGVFSFADWFGWIFKKIINPVCHYLFKKSN